MGAVAIYHLSVKVISRGAGRSCVAAAAYRAGERLEDVRQGLTHDYERRGDVRESWIMAPDDAPEWVYDRQELWTRIDAAEVRRDARTAREIEIALPRELSQEQQRALVQEYVLEQCVSRGMVADVSIHDGKGENPHAHLLLSTREITPEGFGVKVREWDSADLVREWREAWERHCNLALERGGVRGRIDHRSLQEQGIDREPTIHEGPKARAMARRGVESERVAVNQAVREYNAVVIDLAHVRAEREQLRRDPRAVVQYVDQQLERYAPEVREAVARLAEGWNREEVTQRLATRLAAPEVGRLEHVLQRAESQLAGWERWRAARDDLDRYGGPLGWIRRRREPYRYEQARIRESEWSHYRDVEPQACRAQAAQARAEIDQVKTRARREAEASVAEGPRLIQLAERGRQALEASPRPQVQGRTVPLPGLASIIQAGIEAAMKSASRNLESRMQWERARERERERERGLER